MPDCRWTVASEKAEAASVEELSSRLESSPDGLADDEAARRLEQCGPNVLAEEHVHPLLKFLGYFWGPIPWMIEVAAVLSLVVRHWADFGVITLLLVFNAVVGFWQERKAGNAVEALKAHLALKCRVLRGGRWRHEEAARLVPGDVIRMRLGDIVPADAKLHADGWLSVDQSALTGESLPVDKQAGDVVYSGSAVKQGEMVGLVTATGTGTYFGRTAELVVHAEPVSHFQQAVLAIGRYLIYLSLGLVAVLIGVQLLRGAPWLELVQFALILTVAAIPVAMPAVLSVTMAVGALDLSRQKAILSRLQSIEEMAGVDVLCSDKTGTLTRNELTLGDPVVYGGIDPQELILAGSLASREEDRDPIDQAILDSLKNKDALADWKREEFTPFDPVSKRTEAQLTGPDGKPVRFSKGAPQIIIGLCDLDEATRSSATAAVDQMADKGFRALGVARADGDGPWRLLGILSLFDPPREESADTIAQATRHGVKVKMVTGDNVAIARQISRQLGLGDSIHDAVELLEGAPKPDEQGKDGQEPAAVSAHAADLIEQADGFAQVMPEHKFDIVKVLQRRGHLVGMTGDGVNDAPALKQADVGIAVSGATDAARTAAALVLTAPGLSVIVSAIEEARRIFERMNSYAVYRITETIRIMIFVVLAMIAYNFYPITAIMIILLAFFNDVPIMTIAYDRTWLDPTPVRWQMRRVIVVSTVMGMIGLVGSFLMLLAAVHWLHLGIDKVQTYVFLKLAVAGHLTLFVARSRGSYLRKPHPAPVVVWSAIGTKLLATLLVRFGLGLVTPIGWPEIALIWGYSLTWSFLTDAGKILVYRHYNLTMPGR
jgi:H+-transporting ATPase